MIFFLLACAPEPETTADAAPPYQALQEQGFDRYLGAVSPSGSQTDDNGDISYTFDRDDGPRCLRGQPFRTMVRDRGSEDLVFFLQGGGLCYSGLCLASSSAPPGIPAIDVLRGDLPSNPVSDWSATYVPYCDGSLFGGDTDIDDDGDGQIDRYHRGLHNVSAALGVAKEHFPSPRRVLLAGSSGGGYGTISAAVLARLTWPDAPIYVFNDAGVGLGRDQEPEFVRSIIDEFEANDLVPAAHADLLDNGHLTPLIGWQLEQDPNLRVSAYSSKGDYVISQIYLEAPPEEFARWLEEQLGAVHADHPERFQSFLTDGVTHTTLLGDPRGFLEGDSTQLDLIASMLGTIDDTRIGDVTIADWLGEMVSEGDGWVTLED